MEKQLLKVHGLNPDTGHYTKMEFYLNPDKVALFENEGIITLRADGLRYGEVVLRETKEELISQVESINIIR